MEECNCVDTEGKMEILCKSCTFEKYKIGKEPKENIFSDYGLCENCNTRGMRRKPGAKVDKTHVIHLFQCDNCGRVIKKRIKKWRKPNV